MAGYDRSLFQMYLSRIPVFSSCSPEQLDVVVARLEVGDYFGELALFDPAPRNATVTAVGSLSCVDLYRSDFTPALDKVPSYATRSCTAWLVAFTSSINACSRSACRCSTVFRRPGDGKLADPSGV